MELIKAATDNIVRLLRSLMEASADGASEREIETDIVFLLRELGWERRQIRQDVSLSDKDKADIVLQVRNDATLLFEAKRKGRTRGEEAQLNRYCRMLRPSPKIAFLSDGIRWAIFFVGERNLVPLQDYHLPDDIHEVALFFESLKPEKLTALNLSVFDFLAQSEASCRRLNDEEYGKLLPHFIATFRHLVLSNVTLEFPTQNGFLKPISNGVSNENDGDDKSGPVDNTHDGVITLNCDAPPSLTFTSVQAQFQDVSYNNWNNLAGAALKAGVLVGLPEEELRVISGANVRENQSAEKNFKAIEGTNFSFQNMDANRCWQATFRLVKHLHIPVHAEVIWLGKAKNESLRGKKGALIFQVQ